MQTVGCNNNSVGSPRVYRNRRYSPAFDTPHTAALCDVIYLIEDDAATWEDVISCFSALGLQVTPFSSETEYFRFEGKDSAACLILNTHLPDMSGLEVQRRLIEKSSPPAIFISAHQDIALSVRAMKAGAVEFFAKPLDPPTLIAAVQAALAQDRKQRRRKAELADLQARFSLLTPRERQVLPLVVVGLLNKQAAFVLGISEVTLRIHRSQVMRKTQAESLADLVRMTMKLHIPYWRRDQPSQADLPNAIFVRQPKPFGGPFSRSPAMRLVDGAHAVVGCLRRKQFWSESMREAFYLIGYSSGGLSAVLVAVVLGMGRRVVNMSFT